MGAASMSGVLERDAKRLDNVDVVAKGRAKSTGQSFARVVVFLLQARNDLGCWAHVVH